MRYKPFPPSYYSRLRASLASKMKPGSLMVLFAQDEMPRNGDQCHTYRQSSDFYYLTGLDQEKCILILFPDHPVESQREILFTVRTNESMVTWYGHKYSFEEASALSGVKTVKWLDDFESTLRELIFKADAVYLNANENPRFTTELEVREDRWSEKIRQWFPLHTLHRAAPLISEMRLCKQPEEIERMKKACNITRSAFLRLLDFVKPGIWEYEVEAAITHEFIRNGCSGNAYYPIVASGANACILHYISNDAKLKKNELLLLDFGAEYGNYAADLSRTIPISGKFSKRQKACYNAVLRTMKKAKNLIIPGTTIEKINKEVCMMMEEEMIGLGLFTARQVRQQNPAEPLYFKYYMHGNSHFIGLDVHDTGTRQTTLLPGMVLSCEPGIYIKEEGIGIRIENDILVTEKSPVDLMDDIPCEAEEIEELMNQRS